MRNQNQKTRYLDVYLSEDFSGTFSEAVARCDELTRDAYELGFRHVTATISTPERDKATGKRPDGYEVSITLSNHISDVKREYDEETEDPDPGTLEEPIISPFEVVELHG